MGPVDRHAKLNIIALGWAFSTALAVLFVLFMLAALFFPMRPGYAVISTVFEAPIDSSRIWLNGLIWAMVTGAVLATVTGTVYNLIVARQALRG